MATSSTFRTDGWVKSTQGPAVAGALIYICAPQPANVDFLPPTPLATVYSDPNGLVPITQPIISDGFGHYDFYAAPGIYTIVIVNAGKVQQVYPDQSIGGVGQGNSNTTGLVAGANITIIGNIISAIGSGGGPSLRTNGVPNIVQSILNLESTDGSVTIIDIGNGSVNLKAGVVPSLLTFIGNLHYYSSISLSGAAFQSIGMSITTPSPSVQAPTATEGPLTLTQFGLGSQWTEGANCITPGTLNVFEVRCSMADLTNVHNWIGLIPQTNQAALLSFTSPFTPNFPMIAFRYATDQDSTIKCVCSTDNTHVTSSDTGLAPDTNIHIFAIQMANAGTTVNFFIDGVNVGTISTNVPSLGTGLAPILSSIDYLSSAADQQFAVSYMGWTINH